MIKNKIDILKNKVGYQIFPLSFANKNNLANGDLKGIISKLDYLKDLGIDIIWLSPIYESEFIDAGYDIINYFNVDSRMGSMQDFEELIEECKKRNMDIMMDVVLNHSSNKSYEFEQACLAKDNQYHDFYVWKDQPNLADPSIFGGSAWEYNENVQQYYLHIFSKSQPDFNFDNPKLRQWIYSIFNFWINKGVKYFRIDAIEHIGKTTEPYVIRYGKFNKQYLQEMYENVFKNKDVYVFGESWNVNPQRFDEYIYQTNTIDNFFNFSLIGLDWKSEHGAYTINKNRVNFEDLNGYFEWQMHKMVTAPSWTNHDTPRALERYLKFDENQRYYAQTALHTLLFTTMGVPFVFQGEEFGMTPTRLEKIEDYRDTNFFSQKEYFTKHQNYSQADFLKATKTGSRDLCRSIMAWDDSPNSGFCDASVKPWINLSINWKRINAKNDLKNELSIFQYLKTLIQIRKTTMLNWFTNFDQFELIKIDNDLVYYSLEYQNEKVFVIINFTKQFFENLNMKQKQIVLSNYKNNDLKQIKPFETLIFKEI